MHLTDISCFKSLPLWLACYVVYDRHSEAKEVTKWKTPDDIDKYLHDFKQHSLRNPIVEQVLTETLRVVRDVWKKYGTIDEIHIELGREMNSTAEKRKKRSEVMLANENRNLRVKALLMNFMNPDCEIENVRPYSPSQQELLRIYEDGVFDKEGNNMSEEINGILKKFAQTDVNKQPSHREILKYKSWLDQKYISPYTGKPIPLAKLFTSAYEIEHIIPQSLYFDDSFNNKVICEAEVNKRKNNELGYEFIKNHHGEKIELSGGRVTTVLSVEEYEQLIKNNFSHNRTKQRNLLSEYIPEKFIQRQLNDTRYIGREVMRLLSNIVRDEDEQESKSKHVIPCTGGITDYLKKDWGFNDMWNSIILPRFERLNKLTGSTRFTSLNANNKLIPNMPIDLQKGFSKKRIDHRHHAMDAIVIACANNNIVNYLNNSSACHNAKTSRYDLRRQLCSKCKTDSNGNYNWVINKPWPTFTQDALEALQQVVVSFKQNKRVINKTTNYYQHYKDGKKDYFRQEKGDSWAIRKPLHKGTLYGEVNLRKKKEVPLSIAIKSVQDVVNRDLKKELASMLQLGYGLKQIKQDFENNADVWQDVNLSKIEVYYYTKETKEHYYASRALIDTSFDCKKIEEKVTDTGIQKIMKRHLDNKGNNSDLAFSPEGIEEMNRDIAALNKGAFHQPIYKVRVCEKAEKFAVGKKGNKGSKFVEAAKGTNLFFAIYEEEKFDKKTGILKRVRSYKTIPLNVVIDRQKRGLSSAPEDENGMSPKYVLSPNDLVYVPTEEEIEKGIVISNIDKSRIYKMVSCNGYQCFFVKSNVAKPIIDKVEFSSSNKMEKALSSEMIKEICVPLKVDRLGNIISLGDVSCLSYIEEV